MQSMTFPARRAARSGALVAVGAHAVLVEAMRCDVIVELRAPDGAVAWGRIAAVGRPWVAPDGTTSAYGYVNLTLTAEEAA